MKKKSPANLLVSASVTALVLGSTSAALAQTAIWQGTTNDYNTATNWSAGVAPTAGGQSAIFANTGITAVTLSAAVAPDSWTFASNSQNYTVSGSSATLGTGLTDNGAGKSISITTSIAGAGVVSQADTGGGVLTLGGTNTYSGGTTISGGTLLVTNAGALGTGLVTLAGTTASPTLRFSTGAGQQTYTNDLTISGAQVDTISVATGSIAVLGQTKNVTLGTTTGTAWVINSATDTGILRLRPATTELQRRVNDRSRRRDAGSSQCWRQRYHRWNRIGQGKFRRHAAAGQLNRDR